jgi:hypothetical protein
MENNKGAESQASCYYSTERIMNILSMVFQGKKSLSDILKENNITEEIYYLWKLRYLNNSDEK